MLVMLLVPQWAMAIDYISDVYVQMTSGDTKSDAAKLQLKSIGYTPVDHDLNNDTKGYWVYIGYKTSTNAMDAITGLLIVVNAPESTSEAYGDDAFLSGGAKTMMADGKRYYLASHSPLGTDMNTGNKKHNNRVYLYYTKDGNCAPDGTPLTAISAHRGELRENVEGWNTAPLYGGNGQPTEEGGTVYNISKRGDFGDTNTGGGGTYNYILYQTHSHSFSADGKCQDCGVYEAPSGRGTADSPYLVSKHSHLCYLGRLVERNDNTFTARQICDIDCENKEIIPIGYTQIATPDYHYIFKGKYDGGGYIIKRATVNNTTIRNVGIFGYVANATIMNLGVINCNFSSGAGTGALCGFATKSTFTNCFGFDNRISNANGNTTYALIAVSEYSRHNYCYADADVAYQNVNNGSYSNSYSTTKSRAGVTKISKDVFASGWLCYALNSEKTDGSQTWYQNLGSNGEGFPRPLKNTAYTVYKVVDKTCNGRDRVYYTNDGTAKSKQDSHILVAAGTFVHTAPTCTTTGLNYKRCSVCGQKGEETWVTDALGHNFNEYGFCSRDNHHYLPAGGEGTSENPYTISKIGQLYWFSDVTNGTNGLTRNLSACAVLRSDLDCSYAPHSFTPIALYSDTYSSNTYFQGSFVGNGHTISGLNVEAPDTYEAGMFSRIRYGSIETLILENTTVSCSGGTHRIGALVGLQWNNSVIRNCAVLGTTTLTARDGETLVDGGFMGVYASGTFEGCYTNYPRIDGATTTTFVRSFYDVADNDPRLASGQLTYDMNGGSENVVWRQTLSPTSFIPVVDKRPIFNELHGIVYRHNNCQASAYVYNNNPGGSYSHAFGDNGICTFCQTNEMPEGKGTAAAPYLIAKPGHLMWLRDEVNEGNTTTNARMTANINMDGISWSRAIGENAEGYTCNFDGDGYSIQNMNNGSYVWAMGTGSARLFATIGEGGKLYNLDAANINLMLGISNMGLVGVNYGTIEKVQMHGGTCQYHINCGPRGGICAQNYGTINNCGIHDINLCNRRGSDNPWLYVGAICGINHAGATISNCYTWGVTYTYFGTQNAILDSSQANEGTVTNCYSNYVGTEMSGVPITQINANDVIYGKMTYGLNGGVTGGTQAWYQKIGTETFPHFAKADGKTVYKQLVYKANTTNLEDGYRNSSTKTGDVNNDQSTSVADVSTLISVLNGQTLTQDAYPDVDGNGSVTVDDVETLNEKILGIKTPVNGTTDRK